MGKRTRRPARRVGWQQWTADEGRQVVEAWRASGLPLATFARQRGLCAERVRWWRQRLGEWKGTPGEDRTRLGHPCQASRASIETVSWLRLIGYNAVSAWRILAPRKDSKPVAWARAMETLRDALLAAEVTDHRELASPVT
jgi:hypothetical protein